MVRNPADLARRIGLILALILTGYAAMSRGLATLFSSANPDLSLAIYPDNTRALGEASERILAGALDRGSGDRATAMARRAIMLDPTIVPAVVALGLSASAEGDADRADRFFQYSQTLSRRDLATQLYFVESAVSRGDVSDALQHYDIALRATDTAPKLMFPVLLNSITEPQLRRALVGTLRKNPNWAGPFVIEASLHAPDFGAVASLFAELRNAGFQPLSVNENALLINLVAKGDFSTAWRYYKIVHPKANALELRNGEFSDDQASGSVFDWNLGSDDGVSASIEMVDGRGILEFSTTPSDAGVIAQQLLVLLPGAYRLSTAVAGITQNEGSGPYWEVYCTNGTIAGMLDIGPAGGRIKTFARTIVVPPGCPAQWLRLRSRLSDDVQGTTGQVMAVSVERL